MSSVRLVLWHLVASPLAGAVVATAAYASWLRPALPAPSWALDMGAVLCGTTGLLAGGILGFRLAPAAAASHDHQAGSPRRVRWGALGTFGLSTSALLGALLLTGIPALTWPMVFAAVIGGGIASATLRRRG
jgi:hypothetical protein